MKDIVDNYYSYFSELSENPWLGLLVGGKKPKYYDEVIWFANLYALILKGDAIASVAVVDEKVVGLCEIKRKNNNSNLAHIGSVAIAIRKKYRGIGIGTAIIKDVLKKSKGVFDVIYLEVFSNNIKAKKLYEKIGFKYCGTEPMTIKRKGKYLDSDRMYKIIKK